MKRKIGTVRHSYLTMETESESLRSIDAANIRVNTLSCFPGFESWGKINSSNAVKHIGYSICLIFETALTTVRWLTLNSSTLVFSFALIMVGLYCGSNQ